MDNPDTLTKALKAKTAHLCRAQNKLPGQERTLDTIEIVPLIFGVCGAILD